MIRATTRRASFPGHRTWDSELCLLGSSARDGLVDAARKLQAFLHGNPGVRLSSIARTLARDWSPDLLTLAIVASSTEELGKKLAYCMKKLAQPDCLRIQDRSGMFFFAERLAGPGRLGFLFPGEGAQYTNMLRDLCMNFSEARQAFDDVDRACALAGDGFVPSEHIFPPGPADEESEELWDMEGAIEAVVSANTALVRVFQRLGIIPDAAVGHSSGEFIALEMAGAITFKDNDERIRRISEGYLLIKELTARQDIPEGILLTVGATEPETIEALLQQHEEKLLLAMANCPHQYVLCAKPELVDEVTEHLVGKGALVTPLPFSRPYHTPWYEPALEGLRTFFKGYTCSAPRLDLYSCATADLFPADAPGIEDLFVGQWARTVRFEDTIRAMYDRGIRIFVEVGPRGNLIAFVNDILRDEPHAAIPVNRTHRSSITQLHYALGLLAAHGVAMDPTYLYAHRGLELIDLGQTAEPAADRGKRKITFAPGSPVMKASAAITRKPSVAAPSPKPGGSGTREAEPPSRPHVTRPSREAMLAYFDNMQRFLAIQQDFSQQVLGGVATTLEAPAKEPSPEAPSALASCPMLHRLAEHVPGEYLIALATYTLEEDTFLMDHTLGTNSVSITDSSLTGLPVMPLTMTLEIMAEAAAVLHPGMKVVGMKDVQASRWISFESGAFSVRVMARTKASGPQIEVHVEVREDKETDPHRGMRPSMAEAVVVLADTYPPAPTAPPLELQEEKPSSWKEGAIYYDRLFHGPAFQAITSITRWAPNGMHGTLRIPSRKALFRTKTQPPFEVDPVLLDAIGAALGLWDAYEKVNGTVMFPMRVEELKLFAPPLPEGTSLFLDLHLLRNDNETATADIYARDAQGSAYIVIKSWQDRVFRLTPVLHQMLLDSLDHYVSEIQTFGNPDALRKHLVCCVSSEIPVAVLESSHRIWQKMLAFNILDPVERAEWSRLEGSAKRKIHWLWGRAVAKDAVRRYLKGRHDLRMAAPDVRIETDEQGRAVATGPWNELIPENIEISVAHSDDVMAAVAGEMQPGRFGLGVDVQVRKTLSEEFLQGAFSAEDRALITAAAGPFDEWALRSWAAKEATGKALGTGMRFDPRDLVIQTIDSGTGTISIERKGNWAEQLPEHEGRRVLSCTLGSPKSILAVSSSLENKT